MPSSLSLRCLVVAALAATACDGARVPAARLTDAMITGRIRHDLGEFAVELVDEMGGLANPTCHRVNAEVHCAASMGGPAGTNWSVVGEGAAMRIVEISRWAESA